jgi:hypothetical protein
MSLCINMPKIARVLLADGWHECQGFSIDAYEFGAHYRKHAPWGQFIDFGTQQGYVSNEAGFSFTDSATGQQICGPMTAILAVAGKDITRDPKDDDPDILGSPPEPPERG